ncbi:AfsR/SARP family transcriptional regulator [Sphaerisporangium rubeum]|uniref:DNA-binding SARP family transcriptional activator n=2 Tax=Sphaerisporangium rubeum TaxID=321317 RepID=A0A7X0IFA3_9ACTN|nr:AfsR/SARP family transcriptional regulator [Sphaerisporangium rubeum]MBB6473965.1 DNA-binding SARP family transcriptional activator [Sphaerisporangium rubeum]
MEFRVLGSLQVVDGPGDDGDLTPSAAKVRAVLAMLVLRHNQIVSTRELIDELWGERPPATALATLHTYVYKLRKMLGPCGPASVVTKPYGYLLATAPETIDVYRFERLVADGWSALERDDPGRATESLSGALALWRGPALANLAAGELLSAQITRLEEGRLRALQLRLDADLRLGRHRELISELKELIATHPLNEDFYAKLMTALYQAGRRGEALEVYQNLRQILVGQLGLEPSPVLSRLQQRLLSADPGLEDPAPARRPAAPAPRPAPAPAQLPADIADFAGRHDVAGHLAALLTGGSGTAAPVVCVGGMPGAGVTALAVHAAHRVRAAFPSGQLFAALGAGGRPAGPGEVLGAFLRAAGVPVADIPDGADERGNMFRTWCSDRRVLILLDDADSATQIRPLLPGSPGCAVIVTTRSALHGVAGAHAVRLGPLTAAEGLPLLAGVAGQARVDAEPRAAEQIVHLCGGLPPALRAAAARLAAAPAATLASMAARLADPRTRLRTLGVAGLDVRAAFRAAYDRLPGPERGLFHLLGLLPSPHVTAGRVAALLGCGPDHAEHLLARLTARFLLEATPRPGGEVRYTVHDLIRLFARQCLEEELGRDPASPSDPAVRVPARGGPLLTGDMILTGDACALTTRTDPERAEGRPARVLGP